jgi:starch phosphorylase
VTSESGFSKDGKASTLPDAVEVAYFSMEIGLDPAIPTYGGGLGMLAGDTIRSAADLKLPMVAISLLHRSGYFYQKLGADGSQTELPVNWPVDDFLTPLPATVNIELTGEQVQVRAWQGVVAGVSGFSVPVLLLDTDLDGNGAWARSLSQFLYGGDSRYRLGQEAVLGIGGIRMLRALGYSRLIRFHMNEGHSSLLILALLEEQRILHGRKEILPEDILTVHHQCVFTTHTPVPAGHDKFPMDLVRAVLGNGPAFERTDLFCHEGLLNTTYLAMNASHYINGVSKRHSEISHHMFAKHTVESITNGVHARTWTSPPFRAVFDKWIPGWKEDNFSLRYAINVPREEIWQAHQDAKAALLKEINRRTNAGMDADVFTLGFARRATVYKRPTLLFADIQSLEGIAERAGGIQLAFAGKAHPMDGEGKALIRELFRIKDSLAGSIRMVYLDNYDMDLAKLMTAGVDVWLNTPQPPEEASGTSGMKAALNGVPSLSIRDGWWLEGHIEGVTGWAIGDAILETGQSRSGVEEAASLYHKLEKSVLSLFLGDRNGFIDVMRHAIAINGSFFNTQRMLQQYVVNAYFE